MNTSGRADDAAMIVRKDDVIGGAAHIVQSESTKVANVLATDSEDASGKELPNKISLHPEHQGEPATAGTNEHRAGTPSSAAWPNQPITEPLEKPTTPIVPSDDYFASKSPLGYSRTEFARNTSSSTPITHDNNDDWASKKSSAPASPDSHLNVAWEGPSSSNVNPTFLRSTRPTSTPNFQSQSSSRHREGPDYPNYPNQSFKALQDQYHPPPYQPRSPHRLRTRNSHPSQSLSSSSNFLPMSDTPQIPSGAKTVGNTPAQSPGLFSPAAPPRRTRAPDSDDGRSGTPMLHPAHHKPPKETHKLLKDVDPVSGRKTINHYEIFEKLGSGQHGTVKQGRDLENGEFVAVKIVRRFSKKLRLGKRGDPKDMVKKEVAILKRARHPHVVSLFEVIDDDEFGKVYLVLEYVERGEIIWRKQTDKAICYFEKERIQREVANNVDEAYEMAAIKDFNESAPARRIEKRHRLELQKAQAKERFGAQRHRPRVQSTSNFWSLEFDGDVNKDFDTVTQDGSEAGTDVQPPEASIPTQANEASPQSESQLHTPRPRPAHTLLGSGSTSLPVSRPDTPAKSESIMWSPYSEESFSNLELQATLEDIIAGEYNWTPDEEDYRYVPCLTLNQASDAFRDTVLGLEYLHYQGIIHRDIKPANLLWTSDYRVKISDFGVSYLGKPIREDDNDEVEDEDSAMIDEAIELAKTVGTPAFYAPELCDPQYFEVGKQPERPAITGQIDVWALGVTLYGMVFGRLPFWDNNEFKMYEKIARQEVFIPRMRLRGVEHTDKTPSNQDKRLEDILEYEEVDDELRDLLRRLLDKHPSRRITLKEVKHHPWVLRGISDKTSWMDETDPSVQSQGRKIEVSTQEVQDAVVGLTLVDRVKAGFSRVGSVLRGRGSRKRADSNPKQTEETTSDIQPPRSVGSVTLVGSRPEYGSYSPIAQEARRSSLRGDEIPSALRASRENSEHPLAQSVAASPELKEEGAFSNEGKPPRPVSDPQAMRPTFSDRTLSTADSMKTIRAPVPATTTDTNQSFTPSSEEQFSPTTAVVDPNASSTSALGSIFSGAGHRLVTIGRSRERGNRRKSPSQTSRSSSIDTNIEDPHASPSLAISSANATGRMDPPPALRQEYETPRHLHNDLVFEGTRLAQADHHRRQSLAYQGHSRRPTVSIASEVACPPSPDDEEFLAQQRPASAADSNTAFQISSSSDQIVSGDSTAHSRIPSVVSGASSLSNTIIEELPNIQQTHPEKSISPLTIGQRSESLSREQRSDPRLNPQPALDSAAAEEEAAYNGEGEQDDSDSEDEGLAMA